MRASSRFVSSFFLLLAIILFSFSSSLTNVQIFKRNLSVDFSSNAAPVIQLSNQPLFRESLPFILNTMQLQSEFSPGKTAQQSHMVLFQTDARDAGLRLELIRQLNGTYSAAIVIPKTSNPRQLFNIQLGNPKVQLHSGKKYRFYMKVEVDGNVSYRLAELNGSHEILLASDEIKNQDHQWNHFSVKNISLGLGSSPLSTFNGSINHFDIEYRSYFKGFPQSWMGAMQVLFLMAAMLIAIIGNKKKIENYNFKTVFIYLLSSIFIFSYPVMQLYSVNMDNVSFIVALKIMAIVSMLAIGLFSIFALLFRNLEKAFVFTFICALYVLFLGRGYQYLSFIANPNSFVFVSLMVLWILYVVVSTVHVSFSFASYLKKAILILFALSIASVGWNGFASNGSSKVHKNDQVGLMQKKSIQPDIYFILSDMHASQTSVLKHLGFDNHGFIDKLRAMGFYVPNNAASNYPYTVLSIPTMLNLSYLPKSIHQVDEIKKYYSNNQLAGFLKSQGYRYIFISPRRYIIEKSDIADLNLTCSAMSDFEGTLWNYSFLFRVNKFGNTYRDDVLCGFNQLKESVSLAGPKFVFIHILSPHPPYVFQENGSQVALEDQLDKKKSRTFIELNKKGYLGQLKYIENQLIASIDFIRKNAKKPPIIIIQGDHGFPLYTDSDLSSGKVSTPNDNINSRMRVLGAYYFPDGGRAVLYDTITPVNMTRGLLRYYFKRGDLPRISDISYWSSETDLFHFSEVTEVIRSQDMKKI